MDDLIQEFLAETTESLNALDIDIVKLEQNPGDRDLMSRIFRLVHTIKGTCGFLGLPRLERVVHHSENVLGRYREGSLNVTQDSVTLILEAFDRIKNIVAGIAETGSEPEGDDGALIARLDAVYEDKDMPVVEDAAVQESVASLESEAVEVAEPSVPPSREKDEAPVAAPAEDPAAKSLRVSVQVLENLMTMVSELVLTRNQLLQISRQQQENLFSAPLQRLNHVVSELQEGVMQTRMQPIGNAWSKLPRIIRDISVELDKKINLEMRGQETELDRQVLDLIKDPLTHMVRNSGDHGIETPEARKAAGKPEEGRIVLNAYHEGGHIIIEISDDGKGLNTDSIRKKALETGIVTEEQLRDMSEKQIQQFIFSAGFSTAEAVTAVSGRGVGMDVVRTNIEKIGGTIEMTSVFGKGTTFTIKIPLTLAIVSALIVEAGTERYAIPQISVRELVRLSATGENKLEDIHGTPVMRLRDRLLPLISLRKILKMEEVEQGDKSSQVIVVQVGAQSFGIIVDRVFDTEEIVVKPVSRILKGIRIFSGNTILGDGSVIMILDPNGVASMVGDVSTARAEAESAAEEQKKFETDRKTSLLIFRAGPGAPRAVPLALVSRLEEFSQDQIEVSGNKRVVQYRGKLMPLVPFSPDMSAQKEGSQSVLVFSDRDRSMGLMVDEIVDIVEERIDVQLAGEGGFGLLGSAIIQGKAVDVVDVGHFLSVAHSDWFGTSSSAQIMSHGGRRVLLVDDSPFFRNMLAPMLGVAGYRVVTVESAQEALNLSKKGEAFDVIISDIEMPGMSGYEFAKTLRSQDHKWKETPLVALSSHATSGDFDRGKAAGFDDYIAKFDRDALLRTIAQLGEAA
ncbi:MAG: chemotaxis protein CheW [Alphaproteobacteria bacterium]|nr:chemotaxis protein CheW [Alphaproteobacteria bacterium]